MEAKGGTKNFFNIYNFYIPKKNQLLLIVTLFLVSLIVIVTNSILISLQTFTVSIFCGILIYLSRSEKGELFWTKKLGKACAFLGTFSFSLYCIHRPILLLFKLYTDPFDKKFYSLIPVFISVFICLIFSLIFFYLFEKPILILKKPESSVK